MPYLQHLQPSFDIDDHTVTQARAERRALLAPFWPQLEAWGEIVQRVQVVRTPDDPDVPLCIIDLTTPLTVTNDDASFSLSGLNTLILHSNQRLAPAASAANHSSDDSRASMSSAVDWQQHEALLPAYHQLVRLISGKHSNILSCTIAPPFLQICVNRKGYIPWGEAALPRMVERIPVQVIEGSCQWAIFQEFDRRQDPIVAGATIEVLNEDRIGTMGAYIPSKHQFLTCAHVINPLLCHKECSQAALSFCHTITQPGKAHWERELRQLATVAAKPSLLEQLSSTVIDFFQTAQSDERSKIEATKDSIDVFALSKRCFLAYGSRKMMFGARVVDMGIDAALCDCLSTRQWSSNVEISHPVRGPLQVCRTPINFECDSDWNLVHNSLVVKKGRSTGVTFGRVLSCSALVNGYSISNTDFSSHHRRGQCDCTQTPHFDDLLHQLEIQCEPQTHLPQRQFADAGDSGAIVYLWVPDTMTIRPLALLHSSTLDGRAYATPFWCRAFSLTDEHLQMLSDNEH